MVIVEKMKNGKKNEKKKSKSTVYSLLPVLQGK